MCQVVKKLTCLITLLCIVAISTVLNLTHAEVKLQGFSGLNHFVPVGSRRAVYKAKAFKAREHALADDLGKIPETETYKRLAEIGECSISIGNSYTQERGNGSLNRQPVVIVEGDVVNVGRCNR